jgi:hypothetical protein
VQADGIAEEILAAEGVVAEDFAALVHELPRVVAHTLVPAVGGVR